MNLYINNYNLNNEQFDYLIKKSNLNLISYPERRNCLFFALSNNKTQELNLNNEQFDYLIKNTKLEHKDLSSLNALMYAFYYNKKENLNLTQEQFKYLINKSKLVYLFFVY